MADETPAPAPARFVPTIQVRKFVDAAQLKKDLSINPNDVSNAMIEHASLMIHYGTLLAQASKQVDDLTMVLEAAEAKADKSIRNVAASEGAKLTEPQIAKQVATSSRVIAYRKLLNEARQVHTLAKQAVDAFRHRKDMLVSYGMLQRAELQGEVSINRRQAVEAEQNGLRERTLTRLGGNALSSN